MFFFISKLFFLPKPDHPKSIRWIFDDDIVIADSQSLNIQMSDKILSANGSLEVINVQLNDTGTYTCEVTVGYRVYRQTHAIEVQGNVL